MDEKQKAIKPDKPRHFLFSNGNNDFCMLLCNDGVYFATGPDISNVSLHLRPFQNR
jgi:hypothetical protein